MKPVSRLPGHCGASGDPAFLKGMEPVLVSKRDSPIGWRDRERYSRLLSRAFDLLLVVVVSESG